MGQTGPSVRVIEGGATASSSRRGGRQAVQRLPQSLAQRRTDAVGGVAVPQHHLAPGQGVGHDAGVVGDQRRPPRCRPGAAAGPRGPARQRSSWRAGRPTRRPGTAAPAGRRRRRATPGRRRRRRPRRRRRASAAGPGVRRSAATASTAATSDAPGAKAVAPSTRARCPPASNAEPPTTTGVPVSRTASISRRASGRNDESAQLSSTARGPVSWTCRTRPWAEEFAPR